jgi:DNA-directed RNA polymerase specialized sigma24 family protein
VVVDPWTWLERTDLAADGVDQRLLAGERDMTVQYALAVLPDRCRALLLAAVEEPPVPYQELAGRLGMAVGSVGPTRARCLEKLRQVIENLGRDMAEDTASSWAAP